MRTLAWSRDQVAIREWPLARLRRDDLVYVVWAGKFKYPRATLTEDEWESRRALAEAA